MLHKFQLHFSKTRAHSAARAEEQGFAGRCEGRAIVKWGGELADEAFVKAVQIKDEDFVAPKPVAEHLGGGC